MSYRTFGDLRAQVEAELDTEGEEFVSDAEMGRYFNSAVTVCEATIVKLGLREKYLQAESYLPTVAGETDIALPTDIVANKIRKVVYRNGTLVYTMKPLRTEAGYAYEDAAATGPASEYYHYSLYKVGAVNVLRLTPRALLTVSNAIRMIYFKTLNRYTSDAALCDLPEICYEFLLAYVRYRVYAKESAGSANTQDEKANMSALLTLMQETLQNQVADPDMDLMEQDLSHYDEMN